MYGPHPVHALPEFRPVAGFQVRPRHEERRQRPGGGRIGLARRVVARVAAEIPLLAPESLAVAERTESDFALRLDEPVHHRDDISKVGLALGVRERPDRRAGGHTGTVGGYHCSLPPPVACPPLYEMTFLHKSVFRMSEYRCPDRVRRFPPLTPLRGTDGICKVRSMSEAERHPELVHELVPVLDAERVVPLPEFPPVVHEPRLPVAEPLLQRERRHMRDTAPVLLHKLQVPRPCGIRPEGIEELSVLVKLRVVEPRPAARLERPSVGPHGLIEDLCEKNLRLRVHPRLKEGDRDHDVVPHPLHVIHPCPRVPLPAPGEVGPEAGQGDAGKVIEHPVFRPDGGAGSPP